MKQTVAIIGATTPTGQAVAQQLAASWLLVLMDHHENALVDVADDLRRQNPNTSIETLACCKEASWEADVVIVVAADDKIPAIAEKIKAVTTCKPVLQFTTNMQASLAALLPHAKVVIVCMEDSATEPNNLCNAFVKGTDGEALALAQQLLAEMGCTNQQTTIPA